MKLPAKAGVLALVIEELARSVAHAAEHARATREGATHAEAKPENDKDTRALEQSYLARGQASRAEELSEELDALRHFEAPAFGPDDPIRVGALLMVDVDGKDRCLFLLPYGGGVKVKADGIEVQVVTPRAALGAALNGRQQGDDFELALRGERREYSIIAVC